MYCASPQLAVRQAQRWLLASTQDASPAIKVLHANYAAATIDLMRQLWPDPVIIAETGEDPHRLAQEASQAQDQAQALILRQCPSLRP